jgi:hypothetical protein
MRDGGSRRGALDIARRQARVRAGGDDVVFCPPAATLITTLLARSARRKMCAVSMSSARSASVNSRP